MYFFLRVCGCVSALHCISLSSAHSLPLLSLPPRQIPLPLCFAPDLALSSSPPLSLRSPVCVSICVSFLVFVRLNPYIYDISFCLILCDDGDMAQQRLPTQSMSLRQRWTRTRRPSGPQKGSLSSTKNITASFHAPDMVATRLCLPPSSRERQVGVTERGR